MIKTHSKASIIQQAKKDFKKISKTFFQKKDIYPLLLANKLDASQLEITPFINNISEDLHDFVTDQLIQWFLYERFRRFVLSYAKAISKQEGHHGSLFQKLIRRKSLDTIEDYKRLLQYIHHNPIHHFHTKSYDGYPHTSFHDFSSSRYSPIDRKTVFGWFDGYDRFLLQHERYAQRKR